jgi:hypothetical protein
MSTAINNNNNLSGDVRMIITYTKICCIQTGTNVDNLIKQAARISGSGAG